MKTFRQFKHLSVRDFKIFKEAIRRELSSKMNEQEIWFLLGVLDRIGRTDVMKFLYLIPQVEISNEKLLEAENFIKKLEAKKKEEG